jgi:phosphonate transport system ATP-binding protein
MSDHFIQAHELRCDILGKRLLSIDMLSIKHGERIAIIGHNGAGKSTLIKLLTGFMRCSAGRLTVLNREMNSDLSSDALRLLRKDIGQVLQGLHLVARLTALDNILIGSLGRLHGWKSLAGIYPQEEIQRARQALDAVGLSKKADTRTDKLSGGEKQRVAIARMLMQKPRLILADEPTAALDPGAAAEVCELLVTSARDATLITVVHNPTLLPVLAQRVIGLKAGRIVFDVPTSEVNEQRLQSLYDLERVSI